MDQDLWTVKTRILSPLEESKEDNKKIQFDVNVSGFLAKCIIEDENIKEYIIHNNICEGSTVQFDGRPLVTLGECFRQHRRLVVKVLTLKLVDTGNTSIMKDNERNKGRGEPTMKTDDGTIYKFNGDTADIQDAFYMMHETLERIRKRYPVTEREINDLDQILKKCRAQLDHELELLNKEYLHDRQKQ